MGLINNDGVLFDATGQTIPAPYYTLGKTMINVNKNNGAYDVMFNFLVYYNEQAYINNRNCLFSHLINLSLTAEELEQNIYKIGYDALKVQYPNHTDA